MKIEHIMSEPLDPIEPTTTVAAAAKTMRDANVGCLLIGTRERLCGVVTDRDIVTRVLGMGRNIHLTPVWTIMTGPVVWCSKDQRVEDAAETMARHGVRRLPVLDRDGVLSGIVSISDVRGQLSRRAHHDVTFYREVTDSRGRVHKTPLATLHVANADGKEEAVAAAKRMLGRNRCYPTQWPGAVDGYRVATRPAAPQPAVVPERAQARRSGCAEAAVSAKRIAPADMAQARVLQ